MVRKNSMKCFFGSTCFDLFQPFLEISQCFVDESSQFRLHILQEDNRVITIYNREHGRDSRIFGGAGEAGDRDVGTASSGSHWGLVLKTRCGLFRQKKKQEERPTRIVCTYVEIFHHSTTQTHGWLGRL